MAAPTVNQAAGPRPGLADREARRASRRRLEAVALGLVDALLECDDETLAAALRRPPRRPRAGRWRSGAGRLAGRGDRLRALGARAGAVGRRGGPGNAGPRLPSRARRLAAAWKRRAAPSARDRRDPGEPHRPPAAGERSRHSAQGRPPGVLAADSPRPACARGGARSRSDHPTRSSGRRPSDAASRRRMATSPASRARSTPPASESSSPRSSCTAAEASRRPRGRRSPTGRGSRSETVQALFPTLDELVRSCGQHLMESLQLPPADRAPEVFAGAASENERIRRLVETFFGAYERGADGITAGRRERKEVPVVDESMEELDNSFDALVVEALRPQHPDGSSVAAAASAHRPRGVADPARSGRHSRCGGGAGERSGRALARGTTRRPDSDSLRQL